MGIGREHDEIVTTFCGSVTARCTARISQTCRLVTKVVGEAMAPASERQSPSGGNISGAGAALVFFAALAACTGSGHRPPPPSNEPAKPPAVADLAAGITTELDGAAPELGDAIIAELSGDDAGARTAFQRVLDAPDVPAPIAARSALHLAQLEARANNRRHALDLVARAAALAPGDPAITDGVAQVQADVVAASGTGDLRGPKPGMALPGIDAKVATAFAAAERSLARVHAFHPHERLEVWAKEDATEDLVSRYRAIAEHGGIAQIAADYRIGSLYHDLALNLLFERVGEYRGRALAYLKTATTWYRASLAGPQLAEAELWRLAAETDLRTAQDVLAAAGAGD
jgi:hypothetical protein